MRKNRKAENNSTGRILARLKAQELKSSSGGVQESEVTDDGRDDLFEPEVTKFLEDESW